MKGHWKTVCLNVPKTQSMKEFSKSNYNYGKILTQNYDTWQNYGTKLFSQQYASWASTHLQKKIILTECWGI